MDVENSSILGISDFSPPDVVHNFSSSFSFWQGKSFCISWDFGSFIISEEVDTFMTIVKMCYSLKEEISVTARI
jgi:hypothetical protein